MTTTHLDRTDDEQGLRREALELAICLCEVGDAGTCPRCEELEELARKEDQ